MTEAIGIAIIIAAMLVVITAMWTDRVWIVMLYSDILVLLIRDNTTLKVPRYLITVLTALTILTCIGALLSWVNQNDTV